MRTIHEHTCKRGYQCGSTVVQVATDCIDWIGDPHLPDSDELGGWSREVWEDGLWLMQPGIYWPQDKENVEGDWKTRGISPKVILQHASDIKTAYRHMIEAYGNPRFLEKGRVKLYWADKEAGRRSQQFIGMHTAYHRNDWTLWLRWIPLDRYVSFGFDVKRDLHQDTPARTDQPLWLVPRRADKLESAPLKEHRGWHGLDQGTRPAEIDDHLDDTPTEVGVVEGLEDGYWDA
jgi:hypothetical protein